MLRLKKIQIKDEFESVWGVGKTRADIFIAAA